MLKKVKRKRLVLNDYIYILSLTFCFVKYIMVIGGIT